MHVAEIHVEDARKCMRKCVDYILVDNQSNLRSRHVYLMPNQEFVCVEENTSGWFLVGITSFSASVHWAYSA